MLNLKFQGKIFTKCETYLHNLLAPSRDQAQPIRVIPLSLLRTLRKSRIAPIERILFCKPGPLSTAYYNSYVILPAMLLARDWMNKSHRSAVHLRYNAEALYSLVAARLETRLHQTKGAHLYTWCVNEILDLHIPSSNTALIYSSLSMSAIMQVSA